VKAGVNVLHQGSYIVLNIAVFTSASKSSAKFIPRTLRAA